jgi:hypothetical protein
MERFYAVILRTSSLCTVCVSLHCCSHCEMGWHFSAWLVSSHRVFHTVLAGVCACLWEHSITGTLKSTWSHPLQGYHWEELDSWPSLRAPPASHAICVSVFFLVHWHFPFFFFFFPSRKNHLASDKVDDELTALRLGRCESIRVGVKDSCWLGRELLSSHWL